jgi:pimeloyl-ACP methyl ester carboxylesterase
MLGDFLSSAKTSRRRNIYADHAAMAVRLQRGDHRLTPARAAYLAQANAQPLEAGLAWPHDPSFIRSWPTLHSLEEWGDCWRRITAPTLCLTASDPRPGSATADPAVIAERAAYFGDITIASVADTGHNIHHDAPEEAARMIERFLLPPS